MIGLENYYAIRNNPELQARYDEIWVIMRYSPKDRPANFHHVMALAPSKSLYDNFKLLKDAGQWNLDTFQRMYVPRYLTDIATDPSSSSQFAALLTLARAGRNIALCCTCYHEDLCHRSILGGVVQGMCPDIEVICRGDYSHYWYHMQSK